ncbi:MAG: hypothetical protein PHO92_02185 [Candidatus Peribacteraceae bacterium]|nr:hypothetical protein [Candidatus Peribacteraceae bacterium]
MPRIWLHGFLAVGALCALAVVSVRSLPPTASLQQLTGTVDIAFEHQQPLAAHVKMSTLQGQSLIEISHEGEEEVLVSVPSAWRRSEVKNAPLSSVLSEAPALGFTRWVFPPKAAVVFYAKEAPESLLIHNPTRVPLKVRAIRVRMETEEVEQEIVLIKDESVRLW